MPCWEKAFGKRTGIYYPQAMILPLRPRHEGGERPGGLRLQETGVGRARAEIEPVMAWG